MSRRSVRRSSLRPNGSNAVPRRNFSFASQPNAAHHPRAERHLRGSPVAGSRFASSGGARWKREAELAVELGRGLAQERAVGIEPRDLVFVLVGHQLEQVARDRLGEPAFARRLRGFGRPRLLHAFAVARGIGGVLVVGEEGDAARDRLVEILRQPARVGGLARLRDVAAPRSPSDRRRCGGPSGRRSCSSPPPRRSARSHARSTPPRAAARRPDRRSRASPCWRRSTGRRPHWRRATRRRSSGSARRRRPRSRA